MLAKLPFQRFLARLLVAIRMHNKAVLPVYVSMAGDEQDDTGAFRRTKRSDERMIGPRPCRTKPMAGLRRGALAAAASAFLTHRHLVYQRPETKPKDGDRPARSTSTMIS
jgi:hypothetical protein